jgi:hypothetical protein
MNILSLEKKTQIISALVEGNSIRTTSRMTGCSKDTISRLLVSVGKACAEYQDKTLCNLTCKRIECDEIWSFCYSKAKNVPEEHKGEFGYGDVWTWTAIDADTKLVPAWYVGSRDAEDGYIFMSNLKNRLANRIQMTTDGHKVYLDAVEKAFGSEIDYAMLIKVYGQQPENEKRYSPAECVSTEKLVRQGQPDTKMISTSYVKRQKSYNEDEDEEIYQINKCFL